MRKESNRKNSSQQYLKNCSSENEMDGIFGISGTKIPGIRSKSFRYHKRNVFCYPVLSFKYQPQMPLQQSARHRYPQNTTYNYWCPWKGQTQMHPYHYKQQLPLEYQIGFATWGKKKQVAALSLNTWERCLICKLPQGKPVPIQLYCPQRKPKQELGEDCAEFPKEVSIVLRDHAHVLSIDPYQSLATVHFCLSSAALVWVSYLPALSSPVLLTQIIITLSAIDAPKQSARHRGPQNATYSQVRGLYSLSMLYFPKH